MTQIQILGAPVRAQRPWLFARIAESRRAGRPVILYVPEQYTLQAERDLMTGLELPGLLNLDVISPTRLKTLIREKAGSSGLSPLDESGRAMAIHQAVQDCQNDLVCYRQLEGMYGAVARMDQTLTELREEDLTPDALSEMAVSLPSAALRAKYQDLARIWRGYDELLLGRFEDPVSSWRDLCSRLAESGLFAGADLYVYGFDTVRPDLRELLLAAAGVCFSVRLLLFMSPSTAPTGRIFRVQRDSASRLEADLKAKGFSCRLDFLDLPADGFRAPENSDSGAPSRPCGVRGAEDPLFFLETHLYAGDGLTWNEDPAPALRLFAAAHPTAEAAAIADQVRRWHDEGIPWSRIAIALPHGISDAGSLAAALDRYGIPFFYSRREELSRHGVSQLLRGALTCVSQGLSTEALLQAASCGFGTLSREEGARLTAYVQAWGIDRGRWRKPFTRGEDAEEMEELRVRLLAPIDRLHDALRRAASSEESVGAVFRFLQEEGIHSQLLQRQDRLTAQERYTDAIIDRQVWDRLMDTLDQMHALLGGRRATLRQIALLMQGAMERARISALPESEEGVQIGRIGHMLAGRTEALVLPGLNAGSAAVQNGSLLSDSERHTLEEQAGRTVGLDSARMGMIMRADYLRTLSLPEKYLWVSCCLRDEGGGALLPGEVIAEIRRMFPRLREEGGLEGPGFPDIPDSPAQALEGLTAMLREMREGARQDLPAPWQDALRTLSCDGTAGPLLRRMAEPLLHPETPARIAPDTALRLFHGERESISRLECFASCPRQHFLRYGLRPLLPAEFEFTAGDAGNFFHLALQRYIDEARLDPDWPHLADLRVQAMLDRILEDLTLPWQDGPLLKDALGRWRGEELQRRTRHAARMLTRFAANSDFQVLGTEVEFGGAGPLPPLTLNLRDGSQVTLSGKIDRLDQYAGPGGQYLRILDMKSSEKQLDPAQMDCGMQLQLMIYLLSALRAHPGALPAGAVYFPVQDREVKADTPEEAEEMQRKNVQLRGVVLGDADVLRAMDRDQSPYSLPRVFNKDGSISKSASWALEEPVLRRLMLAAEKKAADLCEQIREGQVAASPSVSDDRTPCTFCEFRPVCPVRKSDERPLAPGMSFADVGRGLDK